MRQDLAFGCDITYFDADFLPLLTSLEQVSPSLTLTLAAAAHEP